MKITIVMGFFLPVPALAGGATEKIWHRLAELMAAEGHEVTLISRRWPGLPNEETVGRLRHIRVAGVKHTRSLPINLLLDFLWGLRVLQRLPKADVVVCNTVSLPVYLRRIRPSAGRVAVVLGRMPKGQNRYYGAADLLLATSQAVADKAAQENPTLVSRIFRFPNPIDWHLHREASIQGRPERRLHIGYVGRIHPEKGLEQLLDAACALSAHPNLPDWRLSLIGPIAIPQGGGGEDYAANLRARYGQRLLGRFELVPPVFDKAALAQRYGDIDIFCYPSLAAQGEGLSIAPIEAMAAGAVPVVSRLDCYRDLIIPRENGFDFDQTQPDAIQELTRILTALLSDPALRKRVAHKAQETAARFDYKQTARLLLDRFDSLPQASHAARGSSSK